MHGDQIAVIIKGTGIGREGAAFDGRAGGLRFAVHRVHGEHLEHDAALVYGDRLDEPPLTVVAVVGGGGDIVLALVGAGGQHVAVGVHAHADDHQLVAVCVVNRVDGRGLTVVNLGVNRLGGGRKFAVLVVFRAQNAVFVVIAAAVFQSGVVGFVGGDSIRAVAVFVVGVVRVGEIKRFFLAFHGLHGVGAEGAAVIVMAVDRVAAVAFLRAQLQFVGGSTRQNGSQLCRHLLHHGNAACRRAVIRDGGTEHDDRAYNTGNNAFDHIFVPLK